MLRREPAHALTSLGGELDPHDPQIDVVDTTPHQACGLGAVDELDDAVVAYEQLGGQVADRGLLRFRSTPYGEKELVLCGSYPDFCCALLCPPEVSTQRGSEREQALVALIGNRRRYCTRTGRACPCPCHVKYRSTI